MATGGEDEMMDMPGLSGVVGNILSQDGEAMDTPTGGINTRVPGVRSADRLEMYRRLAQSGEVQGGQGSTKSSEDRKKQARRILDNEERRIKAKRILDQEENLQAQENDLLQQEILEERERRKLDRGNDSTLGGEMQPGRMENSIQPPHNGGAYSKPSVPVFSGSERKGDVTFRQWKYNIGYLKLDTTLSRGALTSAVKRSLKGDAAELVMNLGENATVDEIVEALAIPYGEVGSGITRLQRCHRDSYQRQGETAMEFGMRILLELNLVSQNKTI